MTNHKLLHSVEQRPKTTCELYYAALIPELLPSVQAAVYSCLHFPKKNYAQNSDKISIRIKEIIKNIYAPLEFQYGYKLTSRQKCDIIFNFISPESNYLSIQRKIAKQCLSQGLRTGIVHSVEIEDFAEFNDTFFLSQKFSIPLKTRRDIVDQCKYICAVLKKWNLLDLDIEKIYLNLVYIATKIEKKAIWLKHLLEVKRPKLVILTNAKDISDTAMQIACTATGTTSMLMVHGFPQRSQYPIAASFITSYCFHHDNYLKKLSSTHTWVKGLGWLEPGVTLSDNFNGFLKEKHTVKQTEKYNILFLSQITGGDVHRCTSFIQRLPNILQALEQMDEVETVTLRLRPNEKIQNPFIKAFLAKCECSKLKVSSGYESLAENLRTSNTLMAFSSTGLLYGPYLNMKAIEIRDEAINAVWGGTVLPSAQVYQIGENFRANEFKEFVAQSPILYGEDVFYNWNCELEGLAEFINNII